MATVGIDVSKPRLALVLVSATGRETPHQVSNDPPGHQQLHQWLQQQGMRSGQVCLEATGRYGEAVAAYQSAIRNKTNYPQAHYNLGMSYIALRNRNGALEQYRILQRIDSARATKLFNQLK